jgi:4-hydroxy-3-methylbut-2-enyl diphosphate reductase
MGHVPDDVTLVQTAEEAETVEVPSDRKVAYLTQTTLSVDDVADVLGVLERRFPDIVGPAKKDICYATQNRQDVVKRMSSDVDAIFVVGAPNSSNSNRLVEVARAAGVAAYLVQTCEDIEPEWLDRVETVGVTAGASAPETLVTEIVEVLRGPEGGVVEIDGPDESVHFPLPPELIDDYRERGLNFESSIIGFRERWDIPIS